MQSLRAAFFTTDEDVFRALEKDADVKRRFEEEASTELQMGWGWANESEGGSSKGWFGKKFLRKKSEKSQGEIHELVMRRVQSQGDAAAAEAQQEDGGDVDRILSKGYGHVRAV